jgi:hypothetical protein
MTRSVAWSVGLGLVTVMVLTAVEFLHFAAFCERHLAWKRLQADPSAAARDAGFATARTGDSIYSCTTVHCFGPLQCHDDLVCYCAPSTLGAAALGRFINATCTLDKPKPLSSDAFGACRYARCDQHVDP